MKLQKKVEFLLWLLLYSSTSTQGNQECTERFMELSLVTYRAQQIGSDSVGNNINDALRVLQEYQFNCSSTTITSLILGIDVKETTSSRNLFPSVQVFRPNGSIVNQYDLVTGSKRNIYYSTSNVSTSGVYEYPLNPPIPVMSGDLLAVSQPPQDRSAVRVYYISGTSFHSSQQSLGSSNINLNVSLTTNQLILVYPVTDRYCVNSTNSINASVIRDNALRIHDSQLPENDKQYLYLNVAFSCNGSVTKWIYGGTNHSNNRQPELQIWRQLGPSNYTKIGFSSVDTNSMIGTNLYEFIPQTPLEFQEGDIFGFYFPHRDQSSLNIYEQDGNGPLNRRVTPNSLLPATIAEELASVSNDFVLVTVEISMSTSSSVISISSYEVSTNIINSMIISATPMISMNASLTSVISLISTTPISSFVISAALSNLPVTSIATVTASSTVLSTAVTSTVPVAVIGGVVAAVLCIIILAFLTVTLTAIAFVKKRANKTGRLDIPTNVDPNITLKASPTGIDDSVSMDTFAISNMESNPAYMASTDINTTSIQANPAYASTANPNNIYDTVGPNPDQNDDDDDDDDYI